MLQLAKNQAITDVAKKQMDIRQMELDWYTGNYDTVAGQAAAIAGFAFSQIAAGTPPGAQLWKEIVYILLMCITLGLELNVCMSCMFCNIYGKSLALRGPHGARSMHVAVDNLHKEHKRIFVEFSIGILSYMVSHVFEIMMTHRPRIAFITIIPIALFTLATIQYALSIIGQLMVKDTSHVTGQVKAWGPYEMINDLDEQAYQPLEKKSTEPVDARSMMSGS
eukprot:TRINITY_DN76029_c0_g1_i1.p1 TRINITY_DN76029_c0_g1~~TRINITY_DN76029_c0_g1_i1.p1  ORF type:complete len:222 (-),score=26.58 TRINITY_DN76029_c0_g1_i1:149-814(-)